MRNLIAAILMFISVFAYSQVTTPTIRINQNQDKIQAIAGKTLTEISLCNNDSVMFFSYFYFLDNICVEQQIVFHEVEKEWADSFIVNEMGFVKTDTGFVKEIPTGFLTAKTKSAIVDYHGEKPAIEMSIDLYEWQENPFEEEDYE